MRKLFLMPALTGLPELTGLQARFPGTRGNGKEFYAETLIRAGDVVKTRQLVDAK